MLSIGGALLWRPADGVCRLLISAGVFAGRRAAQVALQVHSGQVQWVAKTHGFIDWQIDGEPQPRIIFNAFDVEGSAGHPGQLRKKRWCGRAGQRWQRRPCLAASRR